MSTVELTSGELTSGGLTSAGEHRQKATSQGSVPLAIVTVSDSRTPETDTSGALIRSLVEAAGHQIVDYRIVKDEPDQVAKALEDFAAGTARLIIFNGGTGISQRDRTYDVISKALEKTLPGFGEIFRMLSYAQVRRRCYVKPRHSGRLSQPRRGQRAGFPECRAISDGKVNFARNPASGLGVDPIEHQ